MSKHPRFLLTIEAPEATDAEAVRQLRALLKALLRGYRLKCVEVKRSGDQNDHRKQRAQNDHKARMEVGGQNEHQPSGQNEHLISGGQNDHPKNKVVKMITLIRQEGKS